MGCSPSSTPQRDVYTDRPMRILFFSHYFPPEGNAPASRTYENCKAWVQDGHDVTVVTCVPNCPDGVIYEGFRNRLRQREVVDGIEVVRVWTYVAANKGTLLRILNFVSYMFSAAFFAMFMRRPDIVIATSPQFFCGWAGLIVSKLRRIPFILEIRDLWPESIYAVGAMRNAPLLRFLELLEKWMYAGATRIVTVGDGYKQKLQEKGVPEAEISVVTNGADLEFFTPRPPSVELRNRFGLESKFVCASVGTLGMGSGLKVVPLAAKILRDKGRDDLMFLLVGDGAVRTDIEALVAEHGLKNVVLTGRQPKKLMPDFIATADVCLSHLQRNELFKTVLPSKIFEAMAMSRPMILGVEGFAADLLRRAEAGICIEPDNPEALGAAVERLADNRDEVEAFGRAGYAYVVKHFNRATLANDYLEILKQTVERR